MVTFRRVSPWYPGHDGAHWDYHDILIHEEEDGDEGAGDEPEGEQEAGQAAHDLPAPLLGHVDLVLLPQGVLLLADVPPELTDVQLEVLDVVHDFCFFFYLLC